MSTNECIEEILDSLYEYKNMNAEKIELFKEKLVEFDKFRKSLVSLNLELQEYMCMSKKNNEIIPNHEYQDRMDAISNDSLTVYVSKAQVYKVYPYENIDDFENDDGTHYRKPEYGPVHEVVRDKNAQKFNIIVTSILNLDQINLIKSHLLTFVKRNRAFESFKLNDITVFKYDGNTEFIMASIKLENIFEKDKMTESFIKFMRQKEESDLANKIQIRQPICDELEGARFYKLPSAKTPLENQKFNILDQLLTTSIPSKSQPSVYIGNIYITQNHNNSHNNTNITTINNESATDNKSLKTFYKHIYDEKPVWYVEKGKVDIDVIENAYRMYFDDHVTTKSIISRQLNGNIFNPVGNSKRTSKKILVSFTDLKKLF